MFRGYDLNYGRKELEIIFLDGNSGHTNCMVYDPNDTHGPVERKLINEFNFGSRTLLKVCTEQGVVEFIGNLRNDFGVNLGERLYPDSSGEFSASEEQIRNIMRSLSQEPDRFYYSTAKIFLRSSLT